jgi:hypothetical protein
MISRPAKLQENISFRVIHILQAALLNGVLKVNSYPANVSVE